MLFRDIIGQRTLLERLISSALAGRIAHTQLFAGPEGDQKLPIALAYAQFLNCKNKLFAKDGHDLNGLPADSCGKCPSCIKFEKLVHPDLHFFFPNNIGDLIKKDSQSSDYTTLWRDFCIQTRLEFTFNEWVEEMGIGSRQAIINIRDCHTIIERLSLKSYEADFRVVILWMAEKLSDTISSTLLKTLEEPTPQTLFLLISENTDQVTGTILSRAQLVQIPALTDEELSAGLHKFYGLDEPAAVELAKYSHGNICFALEELRGSEQKDVFDTLFAKWMRLCYKVDVCEMVSLSETLTALGREPLRNFLRRALENIRLCLLCNQGCSLTVKCTTEKQQFIKNFSPFITPQNALLYYNMINDAIYFIARNANISNLITDTSLQICRLLAAEKKKKNA